MTADAATTIHRDDAVRFSSSLAAESYDVAFADQVMGDLDAGDGGESR